MYIQQILWIALASAQSDQSLLCALWVAKDPNFLQVNSEDWSDWVDAQRSKSLLGIQVICFVLRRLNYFCCYYICNMMIFTFFFIRTEHVFRLKISVKHLNWLLCKKRHTSQSHTVILIWSFGLPKKIIVVLPKAPVGMLEQVKVWLQELNSPTNNGSVGFRQAFSNQKHFPNVQGMYQYLDSAWR